MSSRNPGPTWYDILGVDRDASPDAIKAAWRDATDKFEPGTGAAQFKLFNEAAEVLLDPAKRAAYDADLPDAPVAEESVVDEPVAEEPAVEETVAGEEPAAAPTSGTPPASGLVAALVGRSTLVLAICVPLLVLALLYTAGSLWGLKAGGTGIDSISTRDDASAWDAGIEASSTANRALDAVLAYDYRQMDADRARAVKFLTPAYAKKFDKTFALLTEGKDGSEGPAIKLKAVVTADVLSTGVVKSTRDKATIVAFVNQNSVKGDAAPVIFQNRVEVTLVKRDGAWLIDNVKSY